MPASCAASSALQICAEQSAASRAKRHRPRSRRAVRLSPVEILHHEVLAAVGELIEREDVDDVAGGGSLLTARASSMNRRIRSGYCAACGASTLIATALADLRVRSRVNHAHPPLAEQVGDLVLADDGAGLQRRVG